MNFFKRATTSIIRRPGKTIILLLLVFILGSVIAGAISVEGAISNTDANLRRNMPPLLTIGLNHEEWSEYEEEYDFDWETTFPPQPPRLLPEDVRAIGQLSYVEFYDYISQFQLRSFDLERTSQYGNMGTSWGEGATPFMLRGSTRNELIQVEQGVINIIQGQQFESHHQNADSDRVAVIVSDDFANSNNLSVGSIFILNEWILHEPNEWGEVVPWDLSEEDIQDVYAHIEMELEIIGIFELGERDENDQEADWQRLELLGTFFVPSWALENVSREVNEATMSAFENSDTEMPWWMTFQMGDNEENELTIVPIFMLKNPAYMDDFKESAASLLPEFFEFQDMSSAFDDIASSMETMQTIADWILYVSIGATLLILSLLITLFLRDRRYEMGVYLALGEKKGKIISQILMEVLVTSFVAITLSVFVGNFISSQVSHSMLMNELQAENNDDPWMHHRNWTAFDQIGIPTRSMSAEEMMDQFDVSLTPGTIGLFYTIGLGAVVVSSLFPVIYVVTLNPKKVLM